MGVALCFSSKPVEGGVLHMLTTDNGKAWCIWALLIMVARVVIVETVGLGGWQGTMGLRRESICKRRLLPQQLE